MKNLLLVGAVLLLPACQSPVENAGANAPASVDMAEGPDTPVSSDDPQHGGNSGAQPGSPGNGADDDNGAHAPSSDCPILGSSSWKAWVNGMPGPNSKPTLHTEGTVRVPNAGHRASLSLGPVAETYPLTVTVDLKVTPPSGAAAEVVSNVDVKGSWPIDGEVGSVTIRCGGRTVGRVSPVETVR